MPYSPPKVPLPTRIMRLVDRMRDRPLEWDLWPYVARLEAVDRRAEELGLSGWEDGLLAKHARGLARRGRAGAGRDELLDEAFALVREASSRVLGMRHFDVQMVAGMALARGRVVEMATGEGKTLVAVLPAFLAALSGGGVHVLTFNDYLARRDAAWMGPVYELLGLRVSAVTDGMTAAERREAYLSDVTYATAREVGYDLLRDGLARAPEQRVLRPFNFAVVDEADSLMIDEARVPLVIAGAEISGEVVGRRELAALVDRLEEGRELAADRGGRTAYLTDEGHEKMTRLLGRGDLLSEEQRELVTELNQAVHARALLKRNVDYIVRDGEVKIVDELTGRVARGRQWPDGLHRAVEAKEGLVASGEGRILCSITTQHLLGIYPEICGMTGTVRPSEEELELFYGVVTTVIPPNVTCIRRDNPDLVFADNESKLEAVVAEVARCHESGRPILVGTASVKESRLLARRFEEAGVVCNVLNAADDAGEAAIIAEAGSLGAVTVSTNMAGRGTDIKLGGADGRDREAVVALGGLEVIGTARFESRRVDDQLRGRAGRQGDPGSSRFFVSLKDELMTRYSVKDWFPRGTRSLESGGAIDDPVAHERIAQAQRVIEGQNLDIRRTLWSYTSFLERLRQRVAKERGAALEKKLTERVAALDRARFGELSGRVPEAIIDEAISQIVLFHVDRGWADLLAAVADIREGSHLVRLGGREPLHEFHKAVMEVYRQMEAAVWEGVAESFSRAQIGEDGIDLDREGLRGPTATWTYLVNDDPFDWLGGITSPGNIGLGVAAGLWGGLFVLKALWERVRGVERNR